MIILIIWTNINVILEYCELKLQKIMKTLRSHLSTQLEKHD